MWFSAPLLAALTLMPAQPGGGLSVTNVRSTFGAMGPDRGSNKFIAGDELFVAFDLSGVKPDASGAVRIGVGLELTDSKGTKLFTQASRDREAINSLGGDSMPLFAKLDLGTDVPAGKYNLKITLADKGSGGTQTVDYPFEVFPKGFAMVRLKTSADPDGDVPTPHVGVGQALFVHFSAIEFLRDTTTKQPNLKAEMRILDADGKATLDNPVTGMVNSGLPEGLTGVPMKFLLNLNRAGKFTVEITVTDQVSKKKAQIKLPLDVLKAR